MATMDAKPSIIKPRKIGKGSTIALIAPAGPIKPEQLIKAQLVFEKMGFKTTFNQNILSQNGYLAGDDKIRLDELHQAFEKPDIDAIVCIRGGYGCSRIVDNIDFNLIKQNPKIFVGYSDITVLLNAIQQHTGLITFHGIVGVSAFSAYTKSMFSAILTKDKKTRLIKNPPNKKIEIIYPGNVKGKLAGGNLSLVCSMIGTKHQVDFASKLVFLEEIGEAPYRIDRMLTQLLSGGFLQNASGIILGEFTDCDINNKDITNKNSLSLSEIFRDRLAHLKIPIISGFSFGHVKNQAIFPIGVDAEIETGIEAIRLCESPVS